MKTTLLIFLLLPSIFLRAQIPEPLPEPLPEPIPEESPEESSEESSDSFLVARPNPENPEAEETFHPQFNSSNLDMLLQEIGSLTGKVILRDPQVNDVNITLVSKDPLPVNEFLRAAESLLAMNKIALVPFRDRFIRVVPAAGVERAGVPLILDPNEQQGEAEQLISQIVTLNHLATEDVQMLITERLSPEAKVQMLDRYNSFLLTDTRSNIGRIQRILAVLDRPVIAQETVKIYQLTYATAADVKTRLEALVEQSRETEQVETPNRNRSFPRRNRNEEPVNNPNSTSESASSRQGLVQGKVQIVEDTRTNILVILSRKENDAFFAEMIAALDKKVDPEVTVRIYTLQFASAVDVSATLNELIGSVAESTVPLSQEMNNSNNENRQGQTVRDFIRRNQNQANQNNNESSPRTMGQLGNQTRILADERTNSLIMMGKTQDMDILEGVIAKLDIMLAQVAVRAVIMEVILNENLAYGIDWLQRSLTVNDVTNVNGIPVREPVMSFAGAQNVSTSRTNFRDAAAIDRNIEFLPSSLTYFTTFYDFNLDAVLRLAQGSSETKVIATPIIVTTDNTEASIRVGERRAIPTTTATTIGGSVQSSFEYQNIGLELSVTPRINPKGMVIMQINQTAENVGGTTTIDGNDVPIITSRELEAFVSIRSGGTLVLGGLVREDVRETVNRVPILSKIPLLGALFRSKSTENVRTELLVLISPEVLVTTEEAERMTAELKKATKLDDAEWYRGWDLPDRAEWGKEETQEIPEP